MTDTSTFATRLMDARTKARYSRAALAQQTGIPEKTIEKFEYGTMEPNVSRLKKLAQVLNITEQYLLTGGQSGQHPTKTAPAPSPVPSAPAANSGSSYDLIVADMQHIDDLRRDGLETAWRTAPRLFDAVQAALPSLTFDQLLDLAEVRGLPAPPDEVLSGYAKAPRVKQVETFDAIAERILDTAYFGRDLYTVDMSALEHVADNLELKGDEEGWFSDGWSGHDAIVAALRAPLREQALKGACPDFQNKDEFPDSEAA